MSNFIKKILVDKGEYDRLQQQQLREFQPQLQNMAELRNKIVKIHGNRGMSDDAKVSLLSVFQTRFDKLQKETGLPSTGTLTASSNITSEQKTTNKAKPKSDDGENSTSETTENDDTRADPASDTEEMVIDEKPTALTIQQFGIKRMYEPKAKNLLMKITHHPDILTRNNAGEIVVQGKAEPGTDFDTLFKSMVAPNPNLNQPGIDQFLDALKRIGVGYNELSSKALQQKYAPAPPSGSSKSQLAALKNEPSSIAKLEAPVKSTKTKISSAVKRKTEADQDGKGVKMSRPPGSRPNILYLYP